MLLKRLGIISYALNQQKIGKFKSHFKVAAIVRCINFPPDLAAKTKANHQLVSKAPNQHNRGLRDEFTCLIIIWVNSLFTLP